jgi:hypothetical protein
MELPDMSFFHSPVVSSHLSKVTAVPATKTYRGVEVNLYALLSRHKMEVSCQLHVPVAKSKSFPLPGVEPLTLSP